MNRLEKAPAEVKPFEHHLTVSDAGSTAPDLLAEVTGLSRQKLKQAMLKGALWLERGGGTQRLRRAGKQLCSGDKLHLYYNLQVLNHKPEAARLIADEQSYSVWFKPPGMLSQGSKWSDHATIYRWAEQHMEPQRPAMLVHRLDRAASGLILIAHKKSVAAALAKLFEARQIEKIYQVTVEGAFPVCAAPQKISTALDGRAACSHILAVRYLAEADTSLLKVRIETGRKHQIRRHLSQAGYPVVGDRLYGSKNTQADLQLTACCLAFESPLTGEHKCYRLPEELLPFKSGFGAVE